MTDNSPVEDFAAAPSETLQECIAAYRSLNCRSALAWIRKRSVCFSRVLTDDSEGGRGARMCAECASSFLLNLEAGYREYSAHVD